MNGRILLAACCLTVVAATVQPALSGFEPSPFMNYEGVLRDVSNQPVNGIVSMVFRFYDDPVAGTVGEELLADSHTGVNVSGGLFNVPLGTGAITGERSLPVVFAESPEIWLEVEINGEITAPRIQILSAPQAFNSHYVKGIEIVSVEPLDLYVDAVEGDDGNSGLGPLDAKRTIQAAIDLIPVILMEPVTVHIAGGTYSEGVSIRNRITPSGAGIHVIGEPLATISGPGSGTGLRIQSRAGVTLENLEVTGFSTGLTVNGGPTTLDSCSLSGNAANGIGVWDAGSLFIGDDVHADNNGSNGLRCGRCYVVLQAGSVATRTTFNNNGSKGVSVELSCGFGGGPAEFNGNGGYGVSVSDGGSVDFWGRTDVEASGNTLCNLKPQEHSTIKGYVNANIGGPCVCETTSAYSVCAP